MNQASVVQFAPPFVTTWRVSRRLPKPRGGVAEAAYAGPNQSEAEWTEYRADRAGFVNVHTRFGDQDGLVYLACRIDVAKAGEWELALGHDGGARLFLDGRCALTEPTARNPAEPGRSRVRAPLTAGGHDVVVALDWAGGRGWGVFFRARPAWTIAVRRELYVKAPDERTSDRRSQQYVDSAGLRRKEHRSLQRESDWSNDNFERYSDDNGRTWGEWRNVHGESCETKGEDEINTGYGTEVFNPRYGHFVSSGYQRIFLEGHKKAYARWWGSGDHSFVDHCLMVVRKDGSAERSVELITYEDGADYDPNNWRAPAYLDHNRGIASMVDVDVLDNGEIVFPIEADVRACCRILGLDSAELFPFCPGNTNGMIVVRGTFNASRGNYDLTFSRPIVISNLKSSWGAHEPAAIMLPSGRILAVFRGANNEMENWHTRIEPGTPGHKWYCYSDDGGKTFTDPMPWHFDNREVFYSPASQSTLIRSVKNDRIYWIGNITGPDAYGLYPRYPLVIAEVNDRGLLIKETLTAIDTRGEGDGPRVQLSNFSILQDRETGLIELYLEKFEQRERHYWQGDCWRYFIDVEGAPASA